MASDFQSFCRYPHSSTIDGFVSKYSSPNSSGGVTAVTTSSDSPVRPYEKQTPSVLQRFVDRVRLEYYRYEVTYGVYTLTPWEKAVANAFVIIFLSLLLWTTLVYFPPLLYRKLSRLIWLLTGHSSEEMSAVWTMHADAMSSSSNIHMHGVTG